MANLSTVIVSIFTLIIGIFLISVFANALQLMKIGYMWVGLFVIFGILILIKGVIE